MPKISTRMMIRVNGEPAFDDEAASNVLPIGGASFQLVQCTRSRGRQTPGALAPPVQPVTNCRSLATDERRSNRLRPPRPNCVAPVIVAGAVHSGAQDAAESGCPGQGIRVPSHQKRTRNRGGPTLFAGLVAGAVRPARRAAIAVRLREVEKRGLD